MCRNWKGGPKDVNNAPALNQLDQIRPLKHAQWAQTCRKPEEHFIVCIQEELTLEWMECLPVARHSSLNTILYLILEIYQIFCTVPVSHFLSGLICSLHRLSYTQSRAERRNASGTLLKLRRYIWWKHSCCLEWQRSASSCTSRTDRGNYW